MFQVSCHGFFAYCLPSNPEIEWCAYQLVFNRDGDHLFAINGGYEKKDDGTYDTDYYVLSVYDTESFDIIHRLVGRSPFSSFAQTIFLSWQLAENGQDLESIHVSKMIKSQAVHAKLCTITGMMSTRILGSLPMMGGAVEVSKFAIDKSFPDDVRLNVAFRFDNMPPIAISFPDIIAGPWEHVLGVLLTDENKALYRPSTTHLILGIEWGEYQEDEKKLKELEEELDKLFEALCTSDMGEEELGMLLQIGTDTVVEKIHQLRKDIDKAREKVSEGAKHLKEMLRNSD